jgi:hypothetical protein
MLCRRQISGFAKFVVAALLFAQAALAVAGCDLSQRSAVQAVAAVGEAPCHDHEAPGALESNANLCLVHCTSDAQNVESAVLALQPFTALAVLTVPPAPEACRVNWRRSAAASPYAAPPVRILTHNLRI